MVAISSFTYLSAVCADALSYYCFSERWLHGVWFFGSKCIGTPICARYLGAWRLHMVGFITHWWHWQA